MPLCRRERGRLIGDALQHCCCATGCEHLTPRCRGHERCCIPVRCSLLEIVIAPCHLRSKLNSYVSIAALQGDKQYSIEAGFCAGTPAMQALQGACEELAEQWPARRESLKAVLDQSRQPNSSSGSCPASDAAMLRALAWAEAVGERCAVVDARTGRAAITEFTSAIPQVQSPLPACHMFESSTLPCLWVDLRCPIRPILRMQQPFVCKSMQSHTLCCRNAHDFVYESNALLLITNFDRQRKAFSRQKGCRSIESQGQCACTLTGILGDRSGHYMGGGSAGPRSGLDSRDAAASRLAAAARAADAWLAF